MSYIGKASVIKTGQGVEVPYLSDCDQFIIRSKKDRELRQKEYSDCVVVSVAHAANISYSQAHAFCRDLFDRENKQGVIGFHRIALSGNQRHKEVVGKYLKGKKLKRVKSHTTYRNYSPWSGEVEPKARRMTLKTFLKTYPKGRFIVAFNNHAIAIIDGVVAGNGTATDAFQVRRPINLAVQVVNSKEV